MKNQDQEKIRLQLKEVKENYEKDKKFYQGEIEIMRQEKYELEIILAETQAKYEKEKAVSEGKI